MLELCSLQPSSGVSCILNVFESYFQGCMMCTSTYIHHVWNITDMKGRPLNTQPKYCKRNPTKIRILVQSKTHTVIKNTLLNKNQAKIILLSLQTINNHLNTKSKIKILWQHGKITLYLKNMIWTFLSL